MVPETKLSVDQSFGPLVGGIVSDVQRLVKQHLDLFREELREDFRKSKRAAIVMVVGYVLLQTSCLLVVAMLIGLLGWAVPTVPWWIWCGILGLVTLLAVALVASVAKKMISTMNLKPDQTSAALEEDLRWLKK